MNLRIRLAAGLVCLFLPVLHLNADPVLITDNFNDNVLNPGLWSPVAFGTGAVAERNERLEVTATAGGGGARLRGLVIGDFDLRFDYLLLTDLDQLGPEGEPAVGTVWFFPASGSFLIRTIGDLPGGGMGGCIGAQLNDTNAGEACYEATSEQSGSLRLTRIGNVYSAYHWRDSDWAVLASGPSPLTAPADIWLVAAVSGPNTVSAAFDNFYLQADGFASEVPEPASLAPAAIALALIWRRRQGRARS